MSTVQLLTHYPFKDIGIELIEGFSVYDGHLLDTPNTPHKGIDYVLRKNNEFESFDVFAMHYGQAYQGLSNTWGAFVCIHYPDALENHRYSTIYAHLKAIPKHIPFLNPNHQITPENILAGEYIGKASTSGLTNNIIQLHIELHQKNLVTNITTKCDPYGIYDHRDSEKYPQPGLSLEHKPHFWISDFPTFAG